jgi:hypothetical protein
MFPRQVAENLWILGNEYFRIYLIKGKCVCALVETGISTTGDIVLDHLKNSFPQATVMAGEGADSFIRLKIF